MLLLFIILKCLFVYLFFRYYCHKILKFLKIKNQIKPIPNEELLLQNIELKTIKKLKLLKNAETYCLHEDFLRTNDKQSIRSNIDFVDTFSWVMTYNPEIGYSDRYNQELFSFSDSLSRLTSNPYLLHESVAELWAFEHASDAYFELILDRYFYIEDSQDLVKYEYDVNYIVDEDYYVDPEWNPYLYEYYVEYDKYDGDYYFDEFRNKYSFESYYDCLSDMDYEEHAVDDIEDEKYVDDYYEKTYYGYDLCDPEDYDEAYNYFYYDDKDKAQYYSAILNPDYEYCDYEFFAYDISFYEENEHYNIYNPLILRGLQSSELEVKRNIYFSPIIIFSDEYVQLSWRGRTSDEFLSVFSYPDNWHKKGIFFYNIDLNSGFSRILSKDKI